MNCPSLWSRSSGELSVTFTGPLWFTGELPVVLDALVEVRNAAAHRERIDRRTATEWRDRILGVGCVRDTVELGREFV